MQCFVFKLGLIFIGLHLSVFAITTTETPSQVTDVAAVGEVTAITGASPIEGTTPIPDFTPTEVTGATTAVSSTVVVGTSDGDTTTLEVPTVATAASNNAVASRVDETTTETPTVVTTASGIVEGSTGETGTPTVVTTDSGIVEGSTGATGTPTVVTTASGIVEGSTGETGTPNVVTTASGIVEGSTGMTGTPTEETTAPITGAADTTNGATTVVTTSSSIGDVGTIDGTTTLIGMPTQWTPATNIVTIRGTTATPTQSTDASTQDPLLQERINSETTRLTNVFQSRIARLQSKLSSIDRSISFVQQMMSGSNPVFTQKPSTQSTVKPSEKFKDRLQAAVERVAQRFKNKPARLQTIADKMAQLRQKAQHILSLNSEALLNLPNLLSQLVTSPTQTRIRLSSVFKLVKSTIRGLTTTTPL